MAITSGGDALMIYCYCSIPSHTQRGYVQRLQSPLQSFSATQPWRCKEITHREGGAKTDGSTFSEARPRTEKAAGECHLGNQDNSVIP